MKMRKRDVRRTTLASRLLCATGSLLLLTNVQTAEAQTGSVPLLFEGARLIVGDGSAPIEDAAFVVENNRFTIVGRNGEIQVPAGAVRVDLTGQTVMPALIDTHVHVGGTRQGIVERLNLLAYAGIAAVQDMGTMPDFGPAFRVRAEQPPNGAQLLMTGRGLVGPLGTVPRNIELGARGRLFEDLRSSAIQVMTEARGRRHVRWLAEQRADAVKLWVDDRLGLEEPMTPANYRAVIDEAHRHNLRVIAHVWYLEDAKDLVRAGVDGLAHPIRDKDVDDEMIELLKSHPNVFIQTTLRPTYTYTLTEDPAWFEDPLFVDISTPEEIRDIRELVRSSEPWAHQGWPNKMPFGKELYERIVRNTKKLYEAGVPHALGTDHGGPAPRAYVAHLELKLLVNDVGLTPSEAITLATQSSAKALQLVDLGTIEPGKIASFIVLDANPLDDITNTQRISRVYLRGHEIDRLAFKNRYVSQ